MTITLQALRRSIGTRTQQPFFDLFGEVAREATGGSTTTLVDTAGLLQPNDYWNGQTLYNVDTGVSRYIADFVQSSKTLTVLEPFPNAIAAGVDYEIWSTFTPATVMSAINAALRDAWPFFFDTVEARVVIQNNVGTSYSLSGLAVAPRQINAVAIEIMASSVTGQVTTVVAQNRLKDTNRTFVAADVGKEIRIYEGTSSGDIRTISSIVDSNTVEVSVNFTATLSTTSKYRMVNVNEQTHGYTTIREWRPNSYNNPTAIRLGSHPFGLEGFVMRLTYVAEYPALTVEASTTNAPQEYVELAALARLFSIKLTGAPASEVRNWGAAYQSLTEQLASYTAKNRYSQPNTTFLAPERGISRIGAEYPFR